MIHHSRFLWFNASLIIWTVNISLFCRVTRSSRQGGRTDTCMEARAVRNCEYKRDPRSDGGYGLRQVPGLSNQGIVPSSSSESTHTFCFSHPSIQLQCIHFLHLSLYQQFSTPPSKLRQQQLQLTRSKNAVSPPTTGHCFWSVLLHATTGPVCLPGSQRQRHWRTRFLSQRHPI